MLSIIPLCIYSMLGYGGSNVSLAKALPVGVSIIIANIVLAYVFLRIYDLPVRRFLASKLLKK